MAALSSESYCTTRKIWQIAQINRIGSGRKRDAWREEEWRTVVERFSSGTSCLYSPRLLKQTCTSQEGKLTWLIILLDVCVISHLHL